MAGVGDSTATMRAANLGPGQHARQMSAGQDGFPSVSHVTEGRPDAHAPGSSHQQPFQDSPSQKQQGPFDGHSPKWGHQITTDSPIGRKNILQPRLDDPPFPPPLENMVQSASAAAMKTNVRPDDAVPSTSKFGLDDIVQQAPYEAEAETYLLKVLERRDPTSPQLLHRTETTGSSILSHVSDDIQHVFSVHEESESGHVVDDVHGDACSELTGRLSSARDWNMDRGRYRSTKTMEAALSELTSAMSTMHTLETTPQNAAAAWSVPEQYGQALEGEVVGSSADKLAANASLLFQRKKTDDPTPDDNSVSDLGSVDSFGSRKGRWDHIAATFQKKTENEELDVEAMQRVPEDEELGIQEGDVNATTGSRSGSQEASSQGKAWRDLRFPRARKNRQGRAYGGKFRFFMNPLNTSIALYLKVALLYLILPATGIAVILFYSPAGNPPTGYDKDGTVRSSSASASWWLLFVCVRQVITFSLAMATQLIVVDYLSIHVGGTLKVFGPWITLMIVQSKGWPFICFLWGVLDFCLLCGDGRFYDHWLFWQDTLTLFNEENPSGNVVNSDEYRRVLSIAVSVGAVVAVKRFWLALFLGKQTFSKEGSCLLPPVYQTRLTEQVLLITLQRNIPRS